MTQTATAPRVKRREVWIEMPQEEYEGFRLKLWVNAPSRLWQDILGVGTSAQDTQAASAALKRIVLEHNGWLDEDGNPFPDANTDAFWNDIPTELGGVIIVAAQLEMGKLPNSLKPTKRR